MKRRAICGAFSLPFAIIFVAIAVATAQSGKVDVTGKWLFTVETEAGSGTPTVTLKQDGEKLTGHYSSSNLGEADFSGAVTGNELRFTFRVEVQGMPIDVTYSGSVESKEAMKGTINLAGVAQGTFTGKRQ